MLRKAQPHANPDWHFLLANMFDIDEGVVKWNMKSGGHCPLDMPSFSMREAKNFIDHNLAGANGKPFYVSHDYYGITSLFRSAQNKRWDNGLLYTKLKSLMQFPNGKINLNDTLFAWNQQFTGVKQDALGNYSLKDMLPVFENFYQQHFGGNE
jgi:hypothetical protein